MRTVHLPTLSSLESKSPKMFKVLKVLQLLANEIMENFFWWWRPEHVWKGCRQLRDSMAKLSLH
jgi:hypothetical protein